MQELILERNTLAGWYQLVTSAENESQHYLHEPLESYVVFMLVRFCQETDFLDQPLGAQFLAALQSSIRQVEHLQRVGDTCLMLEGLFPKHIESLSVDGQYFQTLGQGAYLEVFARNAEDVYSQLADEFAMLAELLRSIRKCC